MQEYETTLSFQQMEVLDFYQEIKGLSIDKLRENLTNKLYENKKSFELIKKEIKEKNKLKVELEKEISILKKDVNGILKQHNYKGKISRKLKNEIKNLIEEYSLNSTEIETIEKYMKLIAIDLNELQNIINILNETNEENSYKIRNYTNKLYNFNENVKLLKKTIIKEENNEIIDIVWPKDIDVITGIKCSNCDSLNASEQINPYDAEIHGEENLIVVCDCCYNRIAEEI
jgi:chromosome segregation ATPase